MKIYSNVLNCPLCHEQLRKKNNQYACENKHSFDISKEGYTNLLLKKSNMSGDNKTMVHARRSFLHKGFYKPLCDELIERLTTYTPKVILDAGCGEGYYTNAIAECLDNDIFAFDMSKSALRYAAKRSDRVQYFLTSIFNLPIYDNSIDVILNIFAPSAIDEFKRILKKDGFLIKVDPGADHLLELKEVLYDNVYKNENKILNSFSLYDKKEIKYKCSLSNEDLINLYEMTPYSFKTSKKSSDKLKTIDCLDVTIHFILYVYR